MRPSISIIVPCFNGELFIKNTINSIKNQTFTEWECVIIDDGSKDNSKQIINDEIIDDDRFHFVSQENKGLSSTRNYGINLAKGEYLFFLDSDDSLPDKALSDLFHVIESNKNDTNDLIDLSLNIFLIISILAILITIIFSFALGKSINNSIKKLEDGLLKK